MAVPRILHDLIQAGVRFEIDGGRIRWRNADGRVTPEVIDRLRSHKAEVIDFLTGEPYRHGASVTGLPRTWTGRIVTLDEWRQLSAWDRHGPDGRLFCSVCQDWVRGCPHSDGDAA